MSRIYIIGGAGSGKTTLAQEISARLSIPHFDLDQVLLAHGSYVEAYLQATEKITVQPAWVAEGVFLIWTENLLAQAASR